MPNVLESYLVSLGFAVEESSFRKFTSIMAQAEQTVTSSTGGMLKYVLEAQAGITSGFLSVSAAIVGVADKVAMADQSYRLMGLSMMMSTDSARKMDMVTKSLGASLLQIQIDPELGVRAQYMSGVFDQGMRQLPADFEKNMLGIRDMRMEFERFGMQVKFLGMDFTSDLFSKLFPKGDAAEKISGWLDKFQDQLPKIANELSSDAVPVLKDTWAIMQDLGDVTKTGAVAFTNLIGLLSSDHSIESSEFSFHNLAKAVEHVEHALSKMLRVMTDAEKVMGHGFASASALLAGNTAVASKEAGESWDNVHLGSGLLLGAGGVSAAAGGLAAAGGGVWAGGKLIKLAKLGLGGIGRMFGMGGAAAGEGAAAAAGTGEAVAGTAAVAGEAAGGAGLLATMWPVLLGAGVLAGGNWIARSLSPRFKEWENDKWNGWFGGSDKKEESETRGEVPANLDLNDRHQLEAWYEHGGRLQAFELALIATPALDSLRTLFGPAAPVPENGQNETAAVAPRFEQTKPNWFHSPDTAAVDRPANLAEAPPAGNQPLVTSLAHAIAKVEAGNKPNPLSVRNNNPGNLRDWGSYPKVGGYVKFPDEATGEAALETQIRKNIGRGLTLDQFFAGKPGGYSGFAPAADKNQPYAYASTVAKMIGIDPEIPLNQLMTQAGTGVQDKFDALGAAPKNALAAPPNDQLLGYLQRTPAPEANVTNHESNVDIGGINVYITQPGADAGQIQRAVRNAVRDGLRDRTQIDLTQLQPSW